MALLVFRWTCPNRRRYLVFNKAQDLCFYWLVHH